MLRERTDFTLDGGFHRERRAPAVLVLALLAAGGCTPSAPPEGAPASPSSRRYTVRAEVVRLPEPGAPLRELVLRHEAIPDFVGQEGRVVGMEAMVMPLEVARSLPLDGVRIGDKVEIVLEVDWARPSYRVVQLRLLSSSTVLDLGRNSSR
jgi:hypothetical protein